LDCSPTYTTVTVAVPLSRMFYGHLTLSRDFGLLCLYPAFYFVVYLGVWNM